MIGVGVWSIVQHNSLSQVPLKHSQVLNVVSKDTGTVHLIQSMSKEGKEISIIKIDGCAVQNKTPTKLSAMQQMGNTIFTECIQQCLI